MHTEMPYPYARMMRTTLNIDDELLEQASQLTGMTEKTALIRESLRALIERETARRLAKLGGSDASAKAAPRRRTTAR
jgi:Arc/MetJ family transcription regulator